MRRRRALVLPLVQSRSLVIETSSESPEVNFDLADPHPDALIESLRSFGYTPSAAVADLIDNSITAGASTIKIQMHNL